MTMPRRAILPLLVAVTLNVTAWEAPQQTSLATEDTDQVRTIALLAYPETPQGIWSFPDEDCEVALIPLSDSRTDIYKIVTLYEPDLIPPPGTIIGYLTPTASADKWRALLYTDITDAQMQSLGEFTATFSYTRQGEEASLTFEKSKTTVTFNPLGFVPFLRRILRISRKNASNELPYGLKRTAPSLRLRYL